MANQPKGSIVGLGVTPMGKIYGRRSVDFAAEAIALALDDAGLTKNRHRRAADQREHPERHGSRAPRWRWDSRI